MNIFNYKIMEKYSFCSKSLCEVGFLSLTIYFLKDFFHTR